MVLRRRMSRFTRTTEKFVGLRTGHRPAVCLDVQYADAELADPPGQSPTRNDRHLLPVLQADPAAVEEHRRVVIARKRGIESKRACARATKREEPLVLQKNGSPKVRVGHCANLTRGGRSRILVQQSMIIPMSADAEWKP